MPLLATTAPLLLMLAQDPSAGIDRALARTRRALIESVHYELRFDLGADLERVAGGGTVHFTLREAGTPVVIDFGGEELTEVRVNGTAAALRRVHDHVVIPAELVREGENSLSARFTSPVAATGTPLTRYRDPVDGSDYLYTLLVPADAHRLFPCFDQPDLKATFTLELALPADWQAVANATAIARRDAPDGAVHTMFAKTAPLPTYLFAFAAGPFARLVDAQPAGIGEDPERPLELLVRRSELDELEAELLFARHRDALRWLGDWFGVPYPFQKLDFVLVPGFPYGGMEHAGAIFYREEALVFDHAPTESEQIRRSTLIYHEVSHQWFGNLVTMEWFDDLWLKEGFATFVGYTLLDVLEPGKNAWLRFHQRVKPRAYAVDATPGTTPIFQELQNLADAKSTYGAIVYNKAPAVLRELHARLGAEKFRRGVRLFLDRHRFGNARWQDLAEALRDASAQDNELWSTRWILGRGMPRVRAEWQEHAGVLRSLVIRQEGVQDPDERWPLELEVLLVDPGGLNVTRKVRLTGDEAEVENVAGLIAPECVLINPKDVAYGLFVLDVRSRDWVCEHAELIGDLLLRQTALSALWNTLREGELDPRRWAELALRLLARERDPETHAWLLDTLATTLGRYLPADRAARARTDAAKLLLAQLEAGAPQLALQTVRFLVRHCPTDQVAALARGLLDGSREVDGLELGRKDRFLLAAALLAGGDPEPLAQEQARFAGEDCAKEIYLAEAAAPDEATKKRYFESYLRLGEPPEQWMQDSLPFFHWPGQSELTLRFLVPALERVEWVKEHRRIFFMPAWIDEFVNGHSSAQALGIVERFLEANPDLAPDIRRKVLQSLDSLRRAVAIRARRWG